MYSFVLENWKTLSGAVGVTDITQSESDWMSFQPYQDIVLYTECKNVDKGGATNLQIIYETSPTKDESLFYPMAIVTLVVNQLQVNPIILATSAVHRIKAAKLP